MLRLKVIVLPALSVLLISCIQTYRVSPGKMIGRPPESKPYGTLYYQIKPLPSSSPENYTPHLNDRGLLHSGEKALLAVFRDKSSFKKTIAVNRIPEVGVYCEVEIKGKWPSGELLKSTYDAVAISTLLILPIWSLNGGYSITYNLYIDGIKHRTSKYVITRKQVIWLGTIPFLWVNFFTHSTADALEATAYHFFEDAAPLFSEVQLSEN